MPRSQSKIDYALILSAGFGTRMGELGQKIPKPLWPLFHCSLLELQVRFVLNLGVKKIYINTHHLSQDLVIHIQRNSELEKVVQEEGANILFSREPELLGSGGAIFNLGLKEGTLLTLNSDTFSFASESLWAEAFELLDNFTNVLFLTSVPASHGHGQVLFSKNLITGLAPCDQTKEKIITYSGLGLHNLSKMSSSRGKSAFFHSVAKIEEKTVAQVGGESPKHELEYWDFGTLNQYIDSHFSLMKEPQSKLFQFLVDCKSIDPKLIDLEKNSYSSTHPNHLALDQRPIDGEIQGAMALSFQGHLLKKTP